MIKLKTLKGAEQAGIKTAQLQKPEDLDKEIRKFIDL